MSNYKKETIATHAAYQSKNEQFGSVAVPVHFSTAWDFGTSQKAAARFELSELGPIYSRITNPTVDIFEARIAELECGKAAISTATGSAATFYAITNLAKAGDNIIVSRKIYGGSAALLNNTLQNFGITAKSFDSDNADDLEALIDKNTKAIFYETLSNPQIAIPNTEKIVQIANKYGVITIADNTVATPILYNPLSHGADVVVESATKYIGGQGLTLGGVIVSAHHLNDKLKGNPRYPFFNEPEKNYHGLVFADLAENFDIFTLRIRTILLRDIGATLAPFSAWQLIQGLETLNVRIRYISQSALKIAQWLEKHPKVKSVNYPGLKSSPKYAVVQSDFTDGLASGLLSFDVGDKDLALKIANGTELFRVIVNIGDSKSIITHPASSTHSQLNDEELKAADVGPGLIRLSVGLEHSDDLIADLEKALA